MSDNVHKIVLTDGTRVSVIETEGSIYLEVHDQVRDSDLIKDPQAKGRSLFSICYKLHKTVISS